MSQEDNFWHRAWDDGRTRFHLDQFNPGLLKHLENHAIDQFDSCLVPLCGKTLDLILLAKKFKRVFGIDIVDKPLRDFFKENNLNFQIKNSIHFFNDNISLFQKDFLNDDLGDFEKVDFIYDRASLVAIEPKLRPLYIKQIKRFFHDKTVLHLATFEREKLGGGPPYDLQNSEVYRYFEDFDIKMIEENQREFTDREGNNLLTYQRIFRIQKVPATF